MDDCLVNPNIELSFEQRARAVELENDVSTDEYATAAEIIALRDALVLAVSLQGHKWCCSAGRGMERDCTCGWTDLKALAKTYAVSATVPHE